MKERGDFYGNDDLRLVVHLALCDGGHWHGFGVFDLQKQKDMVTSEYPVYAGSDRADPPCDRRMGITDRSLFAQYGMNTIYSPGLVTSLFGFLPVSIAIGLHLFKKENRPSMLQWVMAVAAMFGFCFLLINLPEDLLGSEGTPYGFTNRGYYERYGEMFEEDYGYEYFEPEEKK